MKNVSQADRVYCQFFLFFGSFLISYIWVDEHLASRPQGGWIVPLITISPQMRAEKPEAMCLDLSA